MSRNLVFKKYANRRLYDTEKSAYVSLNDVAAAIRQGRQVQVMDAKTREDVTAFILTQILLEESRRKNALLPVPLLHLIVRYGENVLSEFFDKYLHQTIENYLTYKTAFDEGFKKWLELGMDFSRVSETSLPGLAPFKTFFELFSHRDDRSEKKKRQE